MPDDPDPGRIVVEADRQNARGACRFHSRQALHAAQDLLGARSISIAQVTPASPLLQVTDDKPVGEHSGKKNDFGELKTRHVRTIRGNQEPYRDRSYDSGEVPCRIFNSSPGSNCFRWCTRLKNRE